MTHQRALLVLVPPALLGTMFLTFRLLVAQVGVLPGYFLGFVVYWRIGNRAPGGTLSFVVASTVLALLWGWVARTTGSIRWTSAVHVLFDFSGLGGRLYFG